MTSEITFFCTNSDCKEYDIGVVVTDIDLALDIRSCTSCYTHGRLKIVHGNNNFTSAGSLVQFFIGLNNEYKLLNKLVTANAADANDKQRLEEIELLLTDAICPCCGQPAKQFK
jgi:hypothetical protein